MLVRPLSFVINYIYKLDNSLIAKGKKSLSITYQYIALAHVLIFSFFHDDTGILNFLLNKHSGFFDPVSSQNFLADLKTNFTEFEFSLRPSFPKIRLFRFPLKKASCL